MRKSTGIKFGGGTVMATSFSGGSLLFGSFVADADWVNKAQSGWLSALGIFIMVAGFVVGLVIWRKSYPVADKEIISSNACSDYMLTKTLQAIHTKRGDIFKKLHPKPQSVDKMIGELYNLYTGMNPPSHTPKPRKQVYKYIIKAVVSLPILFFTTNRMKKGLSVAVYETVKNHSRIENLLNDETLIILDNTLKNERAKISLDKASVAIDKYLEYSLGYWSASLLTDCDLRLIKKTQKLSITKQMMSHILVMHKKDAEIRLNRSLANVCREANL